LPRDRIGARSLLFFGTLPQGDIEAANEGCPCFWLPFPRLCYNSDAVGRKSVSLDIRGPIARLTLCRPERGNAIDASVVRELRDACDVIAANDAVRVVLLSAEGDAFSSGWDWESFSGEGGGPVSAMRSQGIPPIPSAAR
jgi:hypothetical protein